MSNELPGWPAFIIIIGIRPTRHDKSFSPKFLLTAKIQTCLQHLSIYIQPEGDETQHQRLPLFQQQQQQQQLYQVFDEIIFLHSTNQVRGN